MDFQILEINIKEMDSKLFNYIMRSPKLIWDIEKIELYYELIDFDTLSLCSNVAWTKELFEMFMDRWDFKLLSQNKHFCWDSNFIWEHIDKWDFIALSNLSTFPWSLDLISSFIDKLDITALFWNINIQFTGDYIEKHKNSINWKGEINYGGKVKYRYIAAEISRARNVEINVNTLKEKAVLWESGDHVYVRNSEAIPEPSDWHYYSSNHYITEDHLEIFKEKLSWEIVSNNKYIKLNIQMLKKFSKYWDWKIISAREDIPWTDEYLLELNNFLNWDIFLKNKNMVDKIFLPHRNLINNYLLHMKK